MQNTESSRYKYWFLIGLATKFTILLVLLLYIYYYDCIITVNEEDHLDEPVDVRPESTFSCDWHMR